MNLRQLEIFASVMRCGTTVSAADELAMSQSAVSTSIKHMESNIGFRLFERSNNRLVPTEEAKLLLEEAEPLFLHKQALNQRAADLKAGRIGRVRVVVTSELSESIIPFAMKVFLDKHPDVHVSIDIRPLNSVLDAVDMGLADIGFGMEAHERPGLAITPIAELKAVCLCEVGQPLANLPFLTPSDLAGERLIAPHTSNGIGVLVADAFGKAMVDYAPTVGVRFLNIAARLVHQGCGVAILDEITASTGLAENVCPKLFQPHISMTLSAIRAHGRGESILTKDFAAIFKNVARDRISAIRASVEVAK